MSRTHGVVGSAVAEVAGPSAVRALSWLFPLGCLCFSIWLGLPAALYAPDSGQYRQLALGGSGTVPAPFSARMLAPALAGWLGRVTGLGVDTGFLALGILCLTVLIFLVALYLWSWRAPTALFAAIFLMPFWVDLFHDYYLPDLLHGVLLALMLACLLYGYNTVGLLMLFPAFLARESTILVAFCLIFAGWRRIPARSAAAGALALAGGRLVSAHLSHAGPASVHGLGGGAYILGKLVWSLFKNVLGLPLWSNTLPECDPVWVSALPYGAHFGAIQRVGFCQPSLWGPGRLALAWFGVFGVGPAFALVLWRTMLKPAALQGRLWGRNDLFAAHPPAADTITSGTATAGMILVFRFCLIYGLISLLMTPLLGASVDRLVAYGWPFYFVVLAWFIHKYGLLQGAHSSALLSLHLCACWIAWFAFRQETITGFVVGGVAVVFLNAAAYVVLRCYRISYLSTAW